MVDFGAQFITTCTSVDIDSEDELDELMSNAGQIQPPSELSNHDLYYVAGDYDDFELYYSNSEPDTPQYPDQYSAILCNILDEDYFHVHSYAESAHLEDVINFHSKFFPSIDEIPISNFGAAINAEKPFSDLVEPSSTMNGEGEGFSIDAIEVSNDYWNFQMRGESDHSMIIASNLERRKVEPANLVSEINSLISESIDAVEEVLE